MSKADEMFEKLRYEYIYLNKEAEETLMLEYRDREGNHIQFWGDKTISKVYNGNDITLGYITMEELQAINKKCRELGWIEC